MYVVIYDTLLQRSDRSISYRLIFTYLANLNLARRWVFSFSSSSFLCSFILQAYSLWVKCWSKCTLSLELGPQCLMLSQPCLFDNKQINILLVLVYHLNLLSMSLTNLSSSKGCRSPSIYPQLAVCEFLQNIGSKNKLWTCTCVVMGYKLRGFTLGAGVSLFSWLVHENT